MDFYQSILISFLYHLFDLERNKVNYTPSNTAIIKLDDTLNKDKRGKSLRCYHLEFSQEIFLLLHILNDNSNYFVQQLNKTIYSFYYHRSVRP